MRGADKKKVGITHFLTAAKKFQFNSLSGRPSRSSWFSNKRADGWIPSQLPAHEPVARQKTHLCRPDGPGPPGKGWVDAAESILYPFVLAGLWALR
jgi:hypothetical protein